MSLHHLTPPLWLAASFVSCGAPDRSEPTESTTPATVAITASASAAATVPPPPQRTTATASATANATASASVTPPSVASFVACVNDAFGNCGSLAPATASCPARVEQAAGPCGWSGVTKPASCSYGATVCQCVHQPYCGGAAPPPFMLHGMSWQCRAPLKPGECPRDADEFKTSTCSKAGQKCSAATCAQQLDCTCDAGTVGVRAA
jgi:hypothetical protein